MIIASPSQGARRVHYPGSAAGSNASISFVARIVDWMPRLAHAARSHYVLPSLTGSRHCLGKLLSWREQDFATIPAFR